MDRRCIAFSPANRDREVGNGLAEAFGNLDRNGKIRFRQQEGELLAAITSRDINPACVLADAIGQRPQNLIADGMAVSVVDPFEVVDIEHQHRKGPPKTQCAFEFTFTELEKSAPVEQGRQFVGHGNLFDFAIEPRVADGDRGLRGKHAEHIHIRLRVSVR